MLGVFFGIWLTGEEVGCCLWGANLCRLGEELAVLDLEESAEDGKIIGGDSVEERIV